MSSRFKPLYSVTSKFTPLIGKNRVNSLPVRLYESTSKFSSCPRPVLAGFQEWSSPPPFLKSNVVCTIGRTTHVNIFAVRGLSKNSGTSFQNEKVQKALDDEEFRDILKDFAKDFGVNDETAKILEDIKKEQGPSKPDVSATVDQRPDSDTKNASDTLETYRAVAKGRFKEFQDSDASVIHSTEEEMAQLDLGEEFFHIDQEYEQQRIKVKPKRGVTGVYDIHELVDVLRDENLMDITVIEVPKAYHYVDYMVLANAKSPRHAKAVCELIVKFYKMKKNRKDPFIKIEGQKLGSWNAIDMGNIALHIFLEDTRAMYDIESLWLLGSEFDSGGQTQEDSFVNIMQEEMEFFNCLQSNEVSTEGAKETK